MHVKHLQVKPRNGVTRITVLFDKNVPDTVVRCGTAAMLGWKADKAGQWVTSAKGKREYSRTLVPGTSAHHERLCQADGSARRAEHSSHRDRKDHQRIQWRPPRRGEGATKIIWEWERVDMVIGRDNMDCKLEQFCGWPKLGFPLEIMGPLGFYTRKDREELNRRN